MKGVVITGMGVVSSLGRGLNAHADALINARTGLKPLTLFTADGIGARPVGEVANEHLFPGERLSRSQRLTMTAVADTSPRLSGAGVIAVGTTTGGIGESELYYLKKSTDKELLRHHALGTIADEFARTFCLAGERHTFATACSSSANAIGYAAMRVQGGAPWAIAGGVDSLCRITYSGVLFAQARQRAGVQTVRSHAQRALAR